MTNRVVVGSIAGAFGVHGDVRLKSFCADPPAIADYVPLYTDAGHRFDQIVLTGQIKNGFSARLSGVTTKEEADVLRNISLYADRATMPALSGDEYYYTDLIGLAVIDTGGAAVGQIKNVMDNGAGDLLEIARPDQADTVLLPFTLATVPTVDLASGRIIIDPPEGIFE